MVNEIMRLADAYAEAEKRDYLTGEGSADEARAALEAALTEKQEPVAWMHTKIDGVVVTHHPADLQRRPENWTPLYTHPAPVNQQLLFQMVDNAAGNTAVASDKERSK